MEKKHGKSAEFKSNDWKELAFLLALLLLLATYVLGPRCDIDVRDVKLGADVSGDARFLGNVSLALPNATVDVVAAEGSGAWNGAFSIGEIKYSAPIWHRSCSAIGKLIENGAS